MKIEKIIVRVGDLQVEYLKGEGAKFLEDLGRAFVRARGNEAVLKAGAKLSSERQYLRSFVARSETEAYRGAPGYEDRTVYVGDGIYLGTMYDNKTKVRYMLELADRLDFPVDIWTDDGRPSPEEAFREALTAAVESDPTQFEFSF